MLNTKLTKYEMVERVVWASKQNLTDEELTAQVTKYMDEYCNIVIQDIITNRGD